MDRSTANRIAATDTGSASAATGGRIAAAPRALLAALSAALLTAGLAAAPVAAQPPESGRKSMQVEPKMPVTEAPEAHRGGSGGDAGTAVGGGGGGGATGSGICDTSTAVTLIGMNTDSGQMLFAVSSPGGANWILDLDGSAHEARAYADHPAGRFSGSVGPGAVVAVQPCGPDCLQPVRWERGSWQPFGDTLTVPAASTLAATYDESGAPWLVAHAAIAGKDGQFQAWSYRYEGREWKSRGGMVVTAVGQPQVLPAPQQRDAILTGTGLFSAAAPPHTWVEGLPGVPPNRRGQLLALAGASAAYVSSDGVAYLSADTGKTWRRSTWTPWNNGGDTTGMWRQGTEYGIDLPFGDHRTGLQLVWFDRRKPNAERVVLTHLDPAGTWVQLGDAPADVTTRNGERLPVTQILVPHRDTWILLSGCAATSAGSGLVVRTLEKGLLSEARFVKILPADSPGAAGPAAGTSHGPETSSPPRAEHRQ